MAGRAFYQSEGGMLSFIFSVLLTALWGAFAWCSICLASAEDPDHNELLDEHERSMRGD